MKVGPYELVEELGAGAMGRVYRARRDGLEGALALKVIRDDLLDPELEQRFLREVELLARVSGRTGIVRVHDAGRHGQALYYVMDLIEGEDLQSLLRRGPLPPERAAEVMRDVALATHALHQAGVVHRDLKPANVLLDAQGEPWLVDFGLAKAFLNESNRLTRTGELLGTPSYMAPEQIQGDPLTAKTDVFALGGMLFALVAGHPPVQGTTAMAVMTQVLEGPSPRLDSVAPDAPAALVDLCAQALERDPKLRPSARELAEALGEYLEPSPEEAPARLGLSVAALGAAVFLVGVGVYAVSRPAEDPQRSPPVSDTPEEARSPSPSPSPGSASPVETIAEIRDRVRGAQTLPPQEAARVYAAAFAALSGRSDREAADLRLTARAGAKAAIARLARGGHVKTTTLAEGKQGDLRGVAVSRDARLVAAGDEGGRVHLLAYPSLRPVAVVGGDGDKARTVAFGGGGQLIYSWGPSVQVCEPPRWEEGSSWKATDVVRALTVSPQGSLLAMADDEGLVWLIGLKGRGALVKTWRAHKKKVNALAFSPDSRWLVTGSSDRSIKLWEIPFAKGPQLKLSHKPRAVVWGRKELVVLGDDGLRQVWDPETRKPTGQLAGPSFSANAAALSSDGKHLVAVGDEGQIELWDLPARKHLRSFRAQSGDDVDACAFAPDGSFFTGNEDGVLQHWRPPREAPRLTTFREDPQGAIEQALKSLGLE